MTMDESVLELIGRNVVLDTAGPVLYLGRLVACSASGFWLAEADVHHHGEGHATKEQYILEGSVQGIRVNRKRVFVMGHAVISMSALDDAEVD
jgi:hypothetical protein